MAVDTTVHVTLPQMGESVTEGTVLEWHKQEGDHVEADEVIVEVSTDKVDAEVPAPASGTVAKIHAAEGDTVQVGACSPRSPRKWTPTTPRAPAAAPGNGGTAQATEESTGNGAPPPAAEADAADFAAAETIDIVTPSAGESVSEGTLVEWRIAAGDTVEDGQAIAEISTDKIDVELPSPAAGTITEVLVGEGDTVTVGQVIARMTTATNGASATTPAQPATPAEPADGGGNGAATVAPRPIPSDAKVSPVAARIAAAEGIDLASVPVPATAAASRRPTCSRGSRTAAPPPAAAGRRPPPPRAPSLSRCAAARACSPSTWTRAGRSRPRPRSARSPSRRWTAGASN